MGIHQHAALEGNDLRQYDERVDFSEKSRRFGYDGPRYVPSHGGIGDTNTGLFVFKQELPLKPKASSFNDRYEEIRERLAVVNGD